jgi:hypothetical protein
MVRWMRTARAVGTKVPQAIQWAKEVAEYVNTKQGGELRVSVDAFGEYPTIRWFADVESLAFLEQRLGEIMVDQGYWQLIAKAEGLFVEGTINDTVMNII